MEQNEGFKSITSKIKGLEEQLSQCDKILKECEQCGSEAEREIVEHFVKAINMLAARKAVLLDEVSQKIITRSMKSPYYNILLSFN